MSESDKKEKSTVNTGVFGNTHYDINERDFLQRELLKKLDSDAISKRPGPNGQNVHYIETWKAIELANLTFGFNGWSSSIMEISNDFVEQTQQGKFNCGVSAIIRVSLKDGSFHEDIGYGTSDNQKQRGAAIEQAKKTAVSDGLKRALRNFGNALGLTIYDRDHLKQITKPTLKKPGQATNQPKPTNPYFSQSFGTQSPSSSLPVINTTQQHLESIASADYSQTVGSTHVKEENESSLNIDDDLDLDGSAIPESPQPETTTPATNQTPVFQRPSNPSQNQTPPVFQRPSPNQAFKRPANPEASPPNQPANKKTK